MAYTILTLCCVLLIQSNSIQTRGIACNDTTTSRENLTASDDRPFRFHNVPRSDSPFQVNPRILRMPWWTSFMMTIIRYFYQQRADNRFQFGCIYMGNIVNLNEFDPHFYPEVDGRPIIDNSNPISPSTSSNFGNYIASRPERVDGTMVHAESLLLDQLNNLWNAYRNIYGQNPNFILLYSWFMPCPDCTINIINHLRQDPFINVRHRVIVYTSEGFNLPYMSEVTNNRSRELLKQNSLLYWKQRCNEPMIYLSQSTNKQKVEPDLTSLIIDRKTKAYGEVFLEKHGIVGDDPDTHTCELLDDTLQGCLYGCFDTNICCLCQESKKPAMKAALINDLTFTCATSEFVECAKSWIDKNIGIASGCIRHDAVSEQMNNCALLCYDKPLSNPLNLDSPSLFPGLLTRFSKLAEFQKPDLSSFCRDIRTEGFLCSKYTADSFTVGNSLCRSDNKCDYHQGASYSWCYTDFSNNWDYCCTGSCGFSEGTSYLWCSSGDTWQYCGNGGSVDIQARLCLPTFPCGLHQEYAKETYYWCYVDHNKNWDRCCRPDDVCSKKGESYNWCYTDYKSDWQYCKP